MRSLFKITLVLVVMFAFENTLSAQTKTPVKKAPAKKAPAKKAPAAAINVFVCTSNKDKFYHKRASCGGMNKCSEEIKNIKTQGMLNKYKRKKCARCFSK